MATAKQLLIIPTLLRGKLLDYYIDLTENDRIDNNTLKESLIKEACLKKDPLAATHEFQCCIQGTKISLLILRRSLRLPIQMSQ